MSNNQNQRQVQQQQQQQQQQKNRYAHIGAKPIASPPSSALSPLSPGTSAGDTTAGLLPSGGHNHHQQLRAATNNTNHHHVDNRTTATGAGWVAGSPQQQHERNNGYNYNYNNNYNNSVNWRQQWHELRDKFMDKVHEPQSQRRIILVIVCCALLLDNMLYMVIVPIIPDYLRFTGAWSTYAEGAKYVRKNESGTYKWERIGGTIVYEGEESAVGFLFASKAMVQLLINPFSGAIIDRIGYEMPMMIGLVVMFFSTIVFACGQTYSILFLARSLQGVGSAFADTAGLAMIADRFTEDNERQRALGIALAFISFGCLVAPPFGAVLYQTAGKEVPFIILSLVCLVDGFLLLLVTQPGTFASCSMSFLQSLLGVDSSSSAAMATYQPQRQQQQQQQQQQSSGTAIAGQQNDRAAERHIAMLPADKHKQGEQQLATTTDPESQQQQQQRQKLPLTRQKSTSRRQSLTAASNGKTIKGTPIYVLLKDPYIACCSGALIMANVSLAFLEPTISIWMQDTMPDIEEWQMGMIWLPAFIPHVLGVYCTVRLADKYPKYQWLIAAIGLALEGVSSFLVPFCTSFWSLIIPISGICFGIALVDTAILPTLGYLVDTRYVSVYGSIYAIADISYSLSYAIGPIIAGGIVEAIGFTSLNVLIAITNLGYTPVLMMLKHIHDYKPFEELNSSTNNNSSSSTGSGSQEEDGDTVGGQGGHKSAISDSALMRHGYIKNNQEAHLEEEEEEDDDDDDDDDDNYDKAARYYTTGAGNQSKLATLPGESLLKSSTTASTVSSASPAASAVASSKSGIIRDYRNPRWASQQQGSISTSAGNSSQQQQQVQQARLPVGATKQHSVTIVEDPSQKLTNIRREQSVTTQNHHARSPPSPTSGGTRSPPDYNDGANYNDHYDQS